MHCCVPNNGLVPMHCAQYLVFAMCPFTISIHTTQPRWMDVWDSVLQFPHFSTECYWLFCQLVIFRYPSLVNRERKTIKQCNKVVKTCLVLILAKKKYFRMVNRFLEFDAVLIPNFRRNTNDKNVNTHNTNAYRNIEAFCYRLVRS